ncbi:uncharacterized protein B0T23DRAFT_334666 [Neurospora hispaniola]|uniref:DUF7918 domain-containing protein n=1 Tax=Neurospora hispaniola TaxID=588809 RepID=A0AAJ0IE81_9PEZI|nr:hypothetical protein B0T23DRAFT_334666 [Neurospora hispaniola]
MAILSCLPGLKVNIRANGELAKEYDAPPDDVKAGSKKYKFHKLSSRISEEDPYALAYVESKPGEQFEVAIDSTGLGFPDFRRQISLTVIIDNWSLRPHLIRNQVDTFSAAIVGDNVTGWQKISFSFSSLDIVEAPVSEKDIKKQIEEASRYGTIVVKLELVYDGTPASGGGSIAPPKTSVGKVAEKVLKGKAVDSRATFKSQAATAPKFYVVTSADPLHRPFAVFEFRYRTMEGLIREFIVPRPKEVIDVEEEFMRIKRIKPELAVEARGIKREPMDAALFASRYKQRRLEDGKVEIDLTDD